MSQIDPTLIFLHIPKAGGSTLHHVLDWNYDHTRTITVYNQIPPLIALPDAQKRQIQCLKGMVFYGIHRYLPQDCTYITIMRDPVERVISHYFYSFSRKRRLGELIREFDPVEALRHEPFHATYQLRVLLGGDNIESILHDPLPDNAVEIAKQNLARHFAVAGVLDYYDPTLLIMKRRFGWSRAFYARQNVGQERIPRSEIPAPLLDRLTEACAPEIELYQYVKQQTEALIAQQDDSFRAELAQLQRANARFERLHRLTAPMRGTPLWGFARRAVRIINRRG
jgi:hypothetical protein